MIVMKKIFVGLAIVCLTMPFFACSEDFESSAVYGLKLIESPSGEKFYFRREARGFNYDLLSLSKNSDYCSKPNGNTDIIFEGLGPIILFYKFENNELHLYLSRAVKVPVNFSDKVSVIQHDLSNPEFIEMGQTYKIIGLEKVEVLLDEALKCKSRE